jgi:regulatory protein
MITITNIERLYDESFKVHTSAGSSFFMRPRYLDSVPVAGAESLPADDGLRVGAALTAEAIDRLLAASYAYLAERKALTLLNRGEQCGFLLTQKLLKKNFDAFACAKALDYLREQGVLDDARYARSWLSERAGRKSEGRRRLEAELTKRGIAHDIIQTELDAFFEAHDEDAACRAAYEKALRLKKAPDRIHAYLMRQGFSFTQIRKVCKPERE